jgi:ketosteroid isomerase-like protein
MSDNAQVVRGAYERFATGDIPGLLELLSDDVDWASPGILPVGGSYHGHDGAGQFFANVGEKWAEIEVKPDNLVVNGDYVVSLGHVNGKLPSGESTEYDFSHVFEVSDGKVTRFREYVFADDKIG